MDIPGVTLTPRWATSRNRLTPWRPLTRRWTTRCTTLETRTASTTPTIWSALPRPGLCNWRPHWRSQQTQEHRTDDRTQEREKLTTEAKNFDTETKPMMTWREELLTREDYSHFVGWWTSRKYCRSTQLNDISTTLRQDRTSLLRFTRRTNNAGVGMPWTWIWINLYCVKTLMLSCTTIVSVYNLAFSSIIYLISQN